MSQAQTKAEVAGDSARAERFANALREIFERVLEGSEYFAGKTKVVVEPCHFSLGSSAILARLPDNAFSVRVFYITKRLRGECAGEWRLRSGEDITGKMMLTAYALYDDRCYIQSTLSRSYPTGSINARWCTQVTVDMLAKLTNEQSFSR